MTISVNGVAVDAGRFPSPELAAVRELLRQRAVACGFLTAGADDAAAGEAIERLLAEAVQVPTPTEPECRRHYEAHRKEFRSGDLVHARHILFQVTPGVDVAQLRARAEGMLRELLPAPARFSDLAREFSNCPSGQNGGNLGQIGRGDMVPEFEQVLFRLGPTGILREVARTRYGFHIVAVDRRIRGKLLPFEAVREQIANRLKARVEKQALRQYISILAGQAEIVGANLEAAQSPLVQ